MSLPRWQLVLVCVIATFALKPWVAQLASSCVRSTGNFEVDDQ